MSGVFLLKIAIFKEKMRFSKIVHIHNRGVPMDIPKMFIQRTALENCCI